MTAGAPAAPPAPATPAGHKPERHGRPAAETTSAPVIVLNYAHAGGRKVQRILAREPSLACTQGTGILAACHQAAQTWRRAEDRENQALSPLAIASVRALATGMLSVITVPSGGRRWCETATAEPSAAQTFLSLFPATRFICMQRACPDVLYAITRSSPWGISGHGFAPYLVTHPASTLSALAAWWIAQAGSIANFERAHPQSCLRVRYEDLVLDHGATVAAIGAFLGLPPVSAPTPPLEQVNDPLRAPVGIDTPGCGAGLPAAQLSGDLAHRVSELHNTLGYPPLTEGPPG